MKSTNNYISNYKYLICGVILHALMGWVFIALGYNSYKKYVEIVQEYFFLTRAVKDSIQATFPWIVLVFSGLSSIFLAKEKSGRVFLSGHQYVYIIIIYTALLNIVYFRAGENVLFPINLSAFYFIICLIILWFIRIAKDNMANWLPPAMVCHVEKARQTIYNRRVSSNFFIIIFMGLFAICPVLLILNFEKVAEQTADIAYFSLLIGVGTKIYEAFKYEDDGER